MAKKGDKCALVDKHQRKYYVVILVILLKFFKLINHMQVVFMINEITNTHA